MEENQELEADGNKVTSGEENNLSLPSDGPISETEGDDNRPDLNDIEENPDPEPGVPDNDV